MTDRAVLAKLEKRADRIFDDLGLDPDGPPEQFTLEAGRELGRRFAELWPVEQEVRDYLLKRVMREALTEFAATFPKRPNTGPLEFQTYFLGPLVSKFITGRGLTVPQLATLAGVTSEHVYRLNRAGLSILFEEEELQTRTGVNRRFSGLDGRQSHLALDLNGFQSKRWPEPVAFIQPFLLGVMEGLRSWLESPEYRIPIEEGIKRSLPELLSDPILGDLFDGILVGVQRVAQGLRDQILVMRAEKEKVQSLLDMLAELTSRRSEILATLAQAVALEAPSPKALGAGVGP